MTGRNPLATARQGFTHKKTTVESIDSASGLAICRDQLGRLDKINVQNTLGGSMLPQVGEQWMIDRSLGPWTFQARLSAILPQVSDLNDVLNALSTLGIASYNPPAVTLPLVGAGTMRSFGVLTSAGVRPLRVRGDMTTTGTAWLRRNPSAVTGTATIFSGLTTAVVPHSMGVVPTRVLVSPTSSLNGAASFWADTKTATSFTIHLNTNPSSSVTFDWWARVGDL